MHIAIDGRVITDHFPGIGRYVYHLVDALARIAPDDAFSLLHTREQIHTPERVHTPDRIHTTGRITPRYDLATLATYPNVRLIPVDAPVFSLSAQWRVPRALRAARADVFHATYWVGAYRPGVPTVLSLYDLIGARVPGSVPGPRRWALDLAVRLALRNARHVLTLSEASKRDLVAVARVPEESVTVTHLAADARFRPADAAVVAELRTRLGLPSRYVLYVGINKPHKNLMTLVDAWGRVAEDHPEIAASTELVIAGAWDPRYPEVRARAESLPAAARTRFIGPVAESDLPTLYSGAAVFAFPSRYEGFGLPPLEAMACGTPVVAADTTSLPEVVGDAGRLVDPDDVAGWAAALAEILADGALAADLGARGRARAAGFTWEATARRTWEVYRRVAGEGRDR
jgi:glycosyltransferase involved in cell wall biosynthesis